MEKYKMYVHVKVSGKPGPYPNGTHMLDADSLQGWETDGKIIVGEVYHIANSGESELDGQCAMVTEVVACCAVEGWGVDPNGADCPTCRFAQFCTREGLGTRED